MLWPVALTIARGINQFAAAGNAYMPSPARQLRWEGLRLRLKGQRQVKQVTLGCYGANPTIATADVPR